MRNSLAKESKIVREVLRVWDQARDAVSAPLDRWRRDRHDRNFPQNVRQTDGQRGAGARLALFLIYQPQGVAPSILVTCRALIDRGYEILLVSNAPLSDGDRARLVPLCWRIVERPNFGYDFGGYRDGLRVLREVGQDPDLLVILNDSVWFPTTPDCRLLDRLEAEGEAFTGAGYVHDADRKRDNRHFQSFLLLIRREALQSAAFLDYWRNCRLSNRKSVVLQAGEKGFSRAMFRAGFGGNRPPTRAVLLEALSRQPDDVLRRTLDYAAYRDPRHLAEARSLLKADPEAPGWRDQVLAHMARALRWNNPGGVFILAATLLLDHGFLKKRSGFDLFDGMRWQYVRALRNGDLPAPPPEVLSEILVSRMDGAGTTDPRAQVRPAIDGGMPDDSAEPVRRPA